MIIVGLGNPEKKYAHTRHNVGFLVVDALAEKKQVAWQKERKVAWAKSGNHLLIKPLDHMNNSGAALADFLRYKKTVPKNTREILVIHDDVDFPLGTVKLQSNRSSAGHRGVDSIIDTLKTQDFQRLRIGVGSNHEQSVPAEDYVLQEFPAADLAVIQQSIPQALETIEQLSE